jgi:aspartyl-tRNA(Asn)/glutamyl-tRNA(Gln) amidotransferase subunit A
MTYSITEIQKMLHEGEITKEAIDSSIREAITTYEETIHAYIEVFNTAKKDTEGVLSGIPIAIKDNMLFEGHITSASSKILETYCAPYTATAVSLLQNAGANIIGRTNMDEFAMGSSTETSAWGITRNPLDTSRVPGGSSGGSAAAVAYGGAVAALGSDTGGSIRQPAAYCGLVGLKPTYGTVSRHGLIAMASSLDQIGPITKTVTDAELLFSIIGQYDPLDGTSVVTRTAPAFSIKRIGVPWSWLDQGGIDIDIRDNFKQTIKKLEDDGHEIVPIELSMTQHSLPVYYILMPAEVSSNLARFDGIRYGAQHGDTLLSRYKDTRAYGFGPEVRKRILLGTYILSAGYYDAYYGKAHALRTAITSELAQTFTHVDVIMTPTTPTLAFPLGEKMNDPLAMKLSDLFTVPANIAGIPALAVPSGVASNGLQHSVQIMAPHFAEDRLFAIGKEVTQEVY